LYILREGRNILNSHGNKSSIQRHCYAKKRIPLRLLLSFQLYGMNKCCICAKCLFFLETKKVMGCEIKVLKNGNLYSLNSINFIHMKIRIINLIFRLVIFYHSTLYVFVVCCFKSFISNLI
jgi:hypothetical protein